MIFLEIKGYIRLYSKLFSAWYVGTYGIGRGTVLTVLITIYIEYGSYRTVRMYQFTVKS